MTKMVKDEVTKITVNLVMQRVWESSSLGLYSFILLMTNQGTFAHPFSIKRCSSLNYIKNQTSNEKDGWILYGL